MNHQPIAKIVSWNTYGEEVCASAARMSTTEGSALDIYNAALNNPHNANLIGKVLKSGHRSIMEHMVFSIALESNRAQWEIRQVAISMLSLLRKDCPEIFDLYGPSCYLTGVCPEGKMCCGKTKETRTFFSAGSSLDKEAGR